MSHNTALLVIDVQESFRHAPYFEDSGLTAYIAAQQKLIDGAEAAGIPVVQIFHVDGDSAFSADSGLVRTFEGIRITPAATFRKNRHSAFVGTGLDVWLTQRGINRLIVSGIRTEQCCETTTRHGADLGYKVDYVTEATLTFPMTHASGETFSPAEIARRTELVLSGRFATIATVEEVLAREQKAA
ncbi:cysteine hydrolase family protein [Agrobacterium larrymoorei]|uniref:Isochorismatase family protein n=1 Tax=Agrobacterium larrymoorei TaxID=160699 RepID=A0A4D7E4K8_9HYPH|nr:isochorismatase family protein [Agrobacterium larrymoorei]QCI99950.1 isochorismatase family protein [Agrobacterium larrymoorei]QYA09609.1 isochorismatase family protein [Agrobacterium larrymoorei]